MPIAVAQDIIARSTRSRQQQIYGVEEKFNKLYKIKFNHEATLNDLRPSLASPNYSEELDDLCNREDKRSEESTQLLLDTEAEILQIHERCGLYS